MDIIRMDLSNLKHIQSFLALPREIYKNTPQWVPSLQGEERSKLDLKRNPFFQHSDAAFFLAVDREKHPQARIAVLENKRYNEYNQEKVAFFTLFESTSDPSASNGVLDAASDWAQKRGLKGIFGPKGFTALDGLGLLVEGFEHRPAFGIPYNLAYYSDQMERAGFKPQSEMVSGYLDGRRDFPQAIHEISRKVQEKKGLRVQRFHSRRELRALAPLFQNLYNAAIEGTPGNVPLTAEEAQTMVNQIIWFADPRFIKILFSGEIAVGFLFAYPDISRAVQQTGGKLFPLGWIKLLRELKSTPWININGAGIAEKYRGQGGTAILFSEMAYSIKEGHFTHAEIVQIGTDNQRMLNELKNLGIEFYKKHRIYQRDL